MAHDITILHNTIEINGKTVILTNYGSLAEKPYEQDYQAHIEKYLLINNSGKKCLLDNCTSIYGQYPANGFKCKFSCEDTIKNLTVDDTTIPGDAFVVNKIYEVIVNGEHKRFVGNGALHFEIEEQQSTLVPIFGSYFILGVEHILTGIDHIFFIIGFILVAASFSSLLKNITGFTLSHSATLTLAATGLIILSSKIVEPMIALSIILVGLLGIFNIGERQLSRFWLIFTFGLFHGLGFAGAIAEIGFPKTGFVTSLLGFSVGIEAGQLAIVLIVYPCIKMTANKSYGHHIKRMLSSCIVIGGSIWLLQRLFFIA